jgi:hypothetical protein
MGDQLDMTTKGSLLINSNLDDNLSLPATIGQTTRIEGYVQVLPAIQES